MPQTTLYLARHGQSLGNANFKKGLGHLPNTEFGSDLSELGKKQAVELAKELADIHFDAIYSSHLKRATKTAERIAEQKNLKLVIAQGLKEIEEDIENESEATNRFINTVKEILKKHKGSTILIIAHGVVIRSFLRYSGHKHFKTPDSAHLENIGYVKFEVNKDGFKVVKTKGLSSKP